LLPENPTCDLLCLRPSPAIIASLRSPLRTYADLNLPLAVPHFPTLAPPNPVSSQEPCLIFRFLLPLEANLFSPYDKPLSDNGTSNFPTLTPHHPFLLFSEGNSPLHRVPTFPFKGRLAPSRKMPAFLLGLFSYFTFQPFPRTPLSSSAFSKTCSF